jgi:hypothetical protein
MPTQVDGALMHAMSGNELSRVRTEFWLRPPEPIKQSPLESREPTLLCNQVPFQDGVQVPFQDGVQSRPSRSRPRTRPSHLPPVVRLVRLPHVG